MNGLLGNSTLISEVNLRLMLQSVRVMQPTYRSAVARHTGLSRATVTVGVNALLERNVLEEIDDAAPAPRRASGGRPPRLLRVNARAKQVLAIDIEPDCLRVALTDMLAHPLEVRECPIDRREGSRRIVRRLLELGQSILKAHGNPDLLGVGICLPGLIDRENGLAVSSTNMPRWRNVPIRRMVEEAFGAPVHMDRSMNLAALHEWWLHPELESCRVVLLSLRTGIGLSLMDRGQIYRGRQDSSGEIGHTVIDIHGPPCECGGQGCLECFVSTRAVTARGQRLVDQEPGGRLAQAVVADPPLRPQLIYRLAKAGDPACEALVRDIARYIGIAASNAINLLAPDHLLIAGSIDTADTIILDEVGKQIGRLALPRLRRGMRLGLATAQEQAPLLGAAALVARQVFELPKLRRVTSGPEQDAAAG